MKSPAVHPADLLHPVAPLAGAWIEILIKIDESGYEEVAPLAGAWIEITLACFAILKSLVAPLAGAWIEILKQRKIWRMDGSSLPSRERGLKSFAQKENVNMSPVAPLAGAWIEMRNHKR